MLTSNYLGFIWVTLKDYTAQYYLGLIYRYYSEKTEKDLTISFQYFKKAAEQGVVKAQTELGRSYYYGVGTTENFNQAIKWLERAASNNNEYAAYMMGLVYRLDGYNQDVQKSIKWHMMASYLGYVEANIELGHMHEVGFGYLQSDPYEAIKWYKKAADGGSPEGQTRLANIYAGHYIDWDNPDDIFKNEIKKVTNEYSEPDYIDYSKAFILYKKAANQNYAKGQYRLGELYYEGKGTPKNYTEAFKYFLKAANQDDSYAQKKLAGSYYLGNGVTKNITKSLEWLKKSCENDNQTACIYIEYYRENGEIPFFD